jgi:hypothetical protein
MRSMGVAPGSPFFWLLFLGEARKSMPARQARKTAVAMNAKAILPFSIFGDVFGMTAGRIQHCRTRWVVPEKKTAIAGHPTIAVSSIAAAAATEEKLVTESASCPRPT